MGTKYRNGTSYHGAFPAQVIQELVQDLCDMIYPVGCYFETTDTDFDPNDVFVGTWVLETEGLVHISSGTNYAVSSNDKDGGETTVMLQTANIPKLNIKLNNSWNAQTKDGTIQQNTTNNWARGVGLYSSGGQSVTTDGGNTPHNNMQPYKIVNRWYRTE